MKLETASSKWERVPFVGYRPTEPRYCPQCGDMISLRWSQLWKSNVWQAYKCPSCDRFLKFVPSYVMGDGIEYVKELHTARGGKTVYVPTDEWRENEVIQQRLKDLGYW